MKAIDLAPGEMHICPMRIGAERPYVRRLETGEFECGTVRDVGAPGSPAEGLIESEPCREGVRKVTRTITYTARGPACVASSAYRSGWDSTFGARRSAPN